LSSFERIAKALINSRWIGLPKRMFAYKNCKFRLELARKLGLNEVWRIFVDMGKEAE
jgi:hypothetical protein